MSQVIILPIIAAMAIVATVYRVPAEATPHYDYSNDRTEYSHKMKASANRLIDSASVRSTHRNTSKQVCIYIPQLQETSCTYVQIESQ